MFRAIELWLRRRRENAELAAMEAGERERVARDLGVSTSELDYLVRESHDPAQLPRMLAALGIDGEALRRVQPALLRNMRRTCSLCGEVERCRQEFREGMAPLTYGAFCPNTAELDELLDAQYPI